MCIRDSTDRTGDPHRDGERGHPRHPALPRATRLPSASAEHILEIFTDLTRHELRRDGQLIQTFEVDLNPLQQQVLDLLDLLGVPVDSYAPAQPAP